MASTAAVLSVLVKSDTSKAVTGLTALQKKLESASKSADELTDKLFYLSQLRITPKIDLDTGGAEEKTTALQAKLDRLGASSPTIEVNASTAQAREEIDRLANSDFTVHGSVDLDIGAAEAKIELLKREASGIGGGGIGSRVSSGGSSGGGGLPFGIGFNMPTLIGAGIGLAPTVGASLAQGALGAGALATAGAGAGAVGGAGIASVAIGGLTDISAALKAYETQQQSAGAQAVQSAQQQLSAASAQHAAAQQIQTAEESLTTAQQQETFAQQALTLARKDAVRQLTDMRRAATESTTAEQQAKLNLEVARRALAQAPAGTSALELKQLQLSAKEAQQAFRDAGIARDRAHQDANKAQSQGVSQMPQVVAAQRSLASAQKAVADASNNVKQAEYAQAQASKQAALQAKALAISQGQVGIAMKQLPQSGREATKSIVDLKDAWETLSKPAANQFFGLISDGVHEMDRLLPMFARSAESSVSAVRDAFDKFLRSLNSPGFQKFIDTMTKTFAEGIGPLTKGFTNLLTILERIAIAAAPGLLKLLQGFREMTGDWLQSTSNAQKLQVAVAGVIRQFEDWLGLIGAVGQVLGALFIANTKGAKAGGNAVKQLTRTLQGWADWINTHRHKVNEFFINVLHTVEILAGALGNLAMTLAPLSSAFVPISKAILSITTALNSLKVGNVSALTVLLGALTAKGIASKFGLLKNLGSKLFGSSSLGGMLSSRGSTPVNPVFVEVVNQLPGGGTPIPGGGPAPNEPTGPLGKFGKWAGLGAGAIPIVGLAVVGGIEANKIPNTGPGNIGNESTQGGPPSWWKNSALAQAISFFNKGDPAFGTHGANAPTIAGHPMDRKVISADLRPQIQALAEAGKKVPIDLIKRAGLDPQTLRDAGVAIQRYVPFLGHAADHLHTFGTEGHKSKADIVEWGLGVQTMFGRVVDKIKNFGTKSVGGFHEFGIAGQKNTTDIKQWADDVTKQMGNVMDKNDKATKNAQDNSTKQQKAAEDQRKGVSKSFAHQVQNVLQSYQNLDTGTGVGIGNLQDQTNAALKQLGLNKTVTFRTKGNVIPGTHVNTAQKGGMMVGGQGSGDKVPAMLEPGEFVLNREAVKGVGKARLESLNKAIPRFAKGGSVDAMTAMVREANKFERHHFPYAWGGGHSGFGIQPVDCSGAVSDVLHAAGLLNAPLTSGGLESWGQPGKGPLTVWAGPAHTVMGLNGRVFGTSGFNPGGGAGWIDEAHGDGASLVQAAGGLAATRTMDVKGGVIGAAKKLARIILKGPAGAMLDTGQGVLDKSRNAANAFLAKKTPSGKFGGGQLAANDISLKGAKTVTASWYGPIAGQGSNPVGAGGVPMKGNMFAELLMGSALGGLPFGGKIAIGVGNKTAVLAKEDIGAGGPGLGGTTRAVDVWRDAAGPLGLISAGLALARVKRLQGGGMIPSFGGGGVVPGPSGRATPIIAHGGETVMPANKPSRYAITITNWKQGTGYMEEIADGAVNGQRRLGNQLSRMSRA